MKLGSTQDHVLMFEELSTILAEAEAALNSRPLIALDSLPTDGEIALTLGHFLTGRSLTLPVRGLIFTLEKNVGILCATWHKSSGRSEKPHTLPLQ